MDIRGWGIGRIMQLPDFCFGRRYLVSCALDMEAAQRAWDISEVAFPDMAVIWEIGVGGMAGWQDAITVRLALGDRLPATVAEMNALDPLVFGLGLQGAEPRDIRVRGFGRGALLRLRTPVAAQGRRLVIEGETEEAIAGSVLVTVTVSGVPREVPDWVLLGGVSGRL